MNEINVVICDRETRYATSLGENISAYKELAVKVYVCSCIERVLELEKIKPIHISIIDETYEQKERAKVHAAHTFVLSKGHVKDLSKTECEIYKYQSADAIIREVFERYMDETKENIMRSIRKNKTELLAVYSPIHRVGKSRFAIAMGKERAKKQKVLYLNMEEYSGLLDASEGELNLGDLLYYIKQGNNHLSVRLQVSAKKMEGLQYIDPIPISLDLKEVTEKEWLSLLGEIILNSSYEVVILDMGECVQGMFKIMEMCDRVYMPILDDEISRQKIKRFDQNVEQMKLEKLPHIMERFVMPEKVEEYAKLRVKEEV